jgi:hypothetical protein
LCFLNGGFLLVDEEEIMASTARVIEEGNFIFYLEKIF